MKYSDSIVLTVSGTVSTMRLFISFSSLAAISSVTVRKYFFTISISPALIYTIISINIFKYYNLLYDTMNDTVTLKTLKKYLTGRSILIP
ncbi:MAG: hypothetical protein KGI02_10040 [Thaumarchaeota archaeon]|nr:hypothetical protein [Nitrososphaerota archaeon]MDE1841443.1 hypothetical protein [Nitrososphaerota archaeon]